MNKTDAGHRTLGEWLRQCREGRDWPLRKVAAHLDIDPSIVAKMEKGQRHPSRKHLEQLAALFEVPFEEVLVLYLSDRVAYELADESCSDTVLRVAEEKIKYLRSKNMKQGEFEF